MFHHQDREIYLMLTDSFWNIYIICLHTYKVDIPLKRFLLLYKDIKISARMCKARNSLEQGDKFTYMYILHK